MFILAIQRDADVDGAFARYKQYVAAHRHRFPQSAYSLATSDWYFSFSSHQAPHDAWLESIQITEPASGERNETRTVSITIRLLSAYHDGYIELQYPTVYEYRLSAGTSGQGHGDWRYDELRINDKGYVINEIEWATCDVTSTWLIVASDVIHKWLPLT